MARDKNYKVGYGKPPKHSQFKKGQSGNPKGRPERHEVSIAEAIYNELSKEIEIKENGRKQKIMKSEIIAKQIVNNAIKAELKWVNLLQKIVSIQNPREEEKFRPVMIINPPDTPKDKEL